MFLCHHMCMYLTVNAVSIAELWPRQLPDTCICETAIFTPLFGGFGGIFDANDVINCPNPHKDRPCVDARRLSHEE